MKNSRFLSKSRVIEMQMSREQSVHLQKLLKVA